MLLETVADYNFAAQINENADKVSEGLKDLAKEIAKIRETIAEKKAEISRDEGAKACKTIKLHARVTKEIDITEEQAERIINNLFGCVKHAEIDDILKEFTKGIDCGNYETGYIPLSWLTADLEGYVKSCLDKNPEWKKCIDYLKENQCVFADIDL